MKKLLIILISLFIIIIFSIYALWLNNTSMKKNIENYNREYEEYLQKTINGTELATLINKVIYSNDKNNIQKDKNNYYIENDENSIKIEVTILLTEKTYPMEEFYNNDTAEFVKHFNLEKFQCTKIEYHNKSGKVSRMIFEQIEEDVNE